MADIGRRTLLKAGALAPFASALSWTKVEAEQAAVASAGARAEATLANRQYEPQHFDPHQWRTVRILADMIIPADERSGSASDAGVPEFIDFMMGDRPDMQTAIHGGLAWIDAQCRGRFDSTFVDASEPQRGALLDDIAWPARARPELSHGVEFFNRFRDLVATGFWSSRIGVEDLGYIGNIPNPGWDGCPPEQLRRLGL